MNVWKILLALLLAALMTGAVIYGVQKSQGDLVTVQTGKVTRQDLASVVTASGEVKPRYYVNIGANVMGRITEILVKEGDHVRKGQLLARLESVQAAADVRAQEAALAAAEAETVAGEAAVRAADENLKTVQASVDRAQAETDRAKLDYDRSSQLLAERLIARREFDQRKAAYEAASAALREAQSRLAQARAQRNQAVSSLASAQKRVSQVKATVARMTDVYEKHASVAPLDGIVTNLPVRVGETVVPGVQNSSASLIMTIADMSLITAEVKVDETDIVSMRLGNPAEVTIDAIPGRTFSGRVIEIGNTAILRSTGLAASQSAISAQEAKDFKVVIALDEPPAEIKPGLSCTAKVTTATRQGALTIPLQALTIRTKGDLEPVGKKTTRPAAKRDPEAERARKEEVQGVFVVERGKAVFRKVDTGITGFTDIEVLDGLKENETIVTGSYRVIRSLRNEARVKADGQPAAKPQG